MVPCGLSLSTSTKSLGAHEVSRATNLQAAFHARHEQPARAGPLLRTEEPKNRFVLERETCLTLVQF